MAGGSYYNRGVKNNPQTKGTSKEVPSGGLANQVLRKKSNKDYDVAWTEEVSVKTEEKFFITKRFESASISGITEERAIAYSIVMG